MRPVYDHNAAIAAALPLISEVRGSLLDILVLAFLLLFFRNAYTGGQQHNACRDCDCFHCSLHRRQLTGIEANETKALCSVHSVDASGGMLV
jgi:hypothetical protein